MPTRGTPSTSPPRSHVSTQQWQSFEMRMRARRAERCLARARVALDAGIEAEARAALDEARTLKPDTPTLESLRAEVHAARDARLAAARQRHLRTALAAAAALLVLAIGAAWFLIGLPDRPAAGDPRLAVASRQMTAADASLTTVPAPVSGTEPAPVATSPAADAAEAPEVPVATRGAVTAAAEREDAPVATAPAPARTVREESVTLPAVASVPEGPPPSPPTAIEAAGRQPDAAPPAAMERIVSDLPAAPAAVPPPAPAAAAPPSPAISDEPKVRAVLARFESAYSSLNAPAAQAVWPTVDVRALGRAFDSLQAQQISLGDCAIALNGQRARADCRGTMSWTPKIGGGNRSQARRWQFELATAGGAWQIVRAEAR